MADSGRNRKTHETKTGYSVPRFILSEDSKYVVCSLNSNITVCASETMLSVVLGAEVKRSAMCQIFLTDEGQFSLTWDYGHTHILKELKIHNYLFKIIERYQIQS